MERRSLPDGTIKCEMKTQGGKERQCLKRPEVENGGRRRFLAVAATRMRAENANVKRLALFTFISLFNSLSVSR